MPGTNSPLRICIAVNKEEGRLGPSESFLRAQTDRIPGEKYPLRWDSRSAPTGGDEGRFLLSQSLASQGDRTG